MRKSREPKETETTAAELSSLRARVVDGLGYLLARAWLRRRASAEKTDRDRETTTSKPVPTENSPTD
jgi:hypothetical protein